MIDTDNYFLVVTNRAANGMRDECISSGAMEDIRKVLLAAINTTGVLKNQWVDGRGDVSLIGITVKGRDRVEVELVRTLKKAPDGKKKVAFVTNCRRDRDAA